MWAHASSQAKARPGHEEDDEYDDDDDDYDDDVNDDYDDYDDDDNIHCDYEPPQIRRFIMCCFLWLRSA